MSSPSVSVILPVLNERDDIDDCLASLAAQEYDGPVEIVVADGGSDDGTLERLAVWRDRVPRLVLVHNSGRLQSHGLNLAAAVAAGDVLVRADGHSTYAVDYVRRSVDTLCGSSAVAVGGHLRPSGRTPTGRAIAAAMTSALAIGPAAFHHDDRVGAADTVYLGAFRRDDLLAMGGFRALPSGVAEDADLYWRWRRDGRLVLLDPSIRSTYRPRETLRGLARQFHRYGRGKVEMAQANGRLPSWRPLAPAGLLLSALAALVCAFRRQHAMAVAARPPQPAHARIAADERRRFTSQAWAPGAALAAAYVTAVLTDARAVAGPDGSSMRVAAATATMHAAYGSGMWVAAGAALLGTLGARNTRTRGRAPISASR